MTNQPDMDRIIGEYIEINSNILSAQHKSKWPKFIAKLIAKKQRNRLLSTIKKFRNSKYILTWTNLVEYFTFLMNRFPDQDPPLYKSVLRIRIDEMETSRQMEVSMMYENYYAMFYFDNLPEDRIPMNPKFNLIIQKRQENGSNNSINIYLDRLLFKSSSNGQMVQHLNHILINDICDFLELMIDPYTENMEMEVKEFQGSITTTDKVDQGTIIEI